MTLSSQHMHVVHWWYYGFTAIYVLFWHYDGLQTHVMMELGYVPMLYYYSTSIWSAQ